MKVFGNLQWYQGTTRGAEVKSDGSTYGLTGTITFCIPGALTTGANKAPSFIMRTVGTIIDAYAYARTVPSGAALIFDINKNGSTIWATQGNRLQIASGQSTGTQTSFDTTALVANDRLDIDIDQIGSSVAGSDITVELTIRLGS